MIPLTEIHPGIFLRWKDNQQIFDVSAGLLLEKAFWQHVQEGSIEPIPLSPDLLEKAGFTQHHDGCYNEVLYLKEVFDPKAKAWGLYPKELGSGIEVKNARPLQYLHQLQSLYYTITGKHLEFTTLI